MLIFAVSSVVPAHGFVLCFEPDGHVAIEAQAEAGLCGGCLESASAASKATIDSANAPLPNVGGCPCADVPLGKVEALRIRDLPRLPTLGEPVAILPVPAAVFGPEPPVPVRANWESCRGPGGPAQHLTLLMTVVLRV